MEAGALLKKVRGTSDQRILIFHFIEERCEVVLRLSVQYLDLYQCRQNVFALVRKW
jgi:hypothetical protein